MFKCSAPGCSKICKTKGGLRCHVVVKHPEVIEKELKDKEKENTRKACELLHPLDIKRLVGEVAESIYNNECLPLTSREIFKDYKIIPDEARVVFDSIKDIILKFKLGNEHLFIVGFRQASEAKDILPRLKNQTDSRPYLTFVRELTFKCIGHLNVSSSSSPTTTETKNNGPKKFTEREKAALQYLSGHVVRKTFYKLRTGPSWRKPSNKQCVDLLSKCKISPKEEHKLIKARDRGGMWYVCKEMVEIFEATELEFDKATRNRVRRINYKAMTPFIMKNVNVKFAFRKIVDKSQVTIDKELSKDLLEKLIALYLRIRCHSFAKDVREKHKMNKKLNRAKSLRKELEKLEKVKCQEL